jgi:hypothetical protein
MKGDLKMRFLVTGLIISLAIVSSSLSQDVGVINSIYVDDNAPSDPGPQNPDISDPNEDGTQEHPFDMIQEAIDAAEDGGVVVVLEGLYLETINFNGKSITVTSFDPNAKSEELLPWPIIDGNDQGPVVTFNQGEDPNTVLSGLEIRGGLAHIGSAIQCQNSSPTISNCSIIGNRTTDLDFGAIVFCMNSNSVFENCTIADNYAGEKGSCFYIVHSNVTISNSIIWGNTPQQIVVASGNDPIVVYCDVQGKWPGEGNIDSDPLFAYMGYWADSNDPNLMPTEPNDPNAVWIEGDYHLMSMKGRWDPVFMSWIKDKSMSPCVDAGDPASPYANEPEPNGERINMGAYGGTTQASLTRVLYTLTLTSSNGGSVNTPGEGTFTYDEGTQVQVGVASDKLYYFLKWTGSAVDAGKVANPLSPNLTILMDGDYTLRASFASVCFDLTATSTDGGSITKPGEGYFTVCGNFLIALEAVADPHYHFVNWTGSAVDADNVVDPDDPVTSIFVLGDYAVVANFAIDTYTLTISSTDGGSVTTPGEGSFEYDYGTVVDVVATPDEHYHFVNWTGTAVDAGKVADPNSASTSVTVEADYTLTANFEIDTYTLRICSTCGGSVTTPGEGIFEYDYGTVVDLVATPDCGYEFKCWAGPVADPASACTTVTIIEDTCVRAVFEKQECLIDPPD